jgi:hypothetical protein
VRLVSSSSLLDTFATKIRITRVSFARLAWLGKKNAMIAVTDSKSKKNTNIQSQTRGVGGYAACAGASSTNLEFIGSLTPTANPLGLKPRAIYAVWKSQLTGPRIHSSMKDTKSGIICLTKIRESVQLAKASSRGTRRSGFPRRVPGTLMSGTISIFIAGVVVHESKEHL